MNSTRASKLHDLIVSARIKHRNEITEAGVSIIMIKYEYVGVSLAMFLSIMFSLFPFMIPAAVMKTLKIFPRVSIYSWTESAAKSTKAASFVAMKAQTVSFPFLPFVPFPITCTIILCDPAKAKYLQSTACGEKNLPRFDGALSDLLEIDFFSMTLSSGAIISATGQALRYIDQLLLMLTLTNQDATASVV